MPKGSRSSQRSRSSQAILLDVHQCTIDQLTRLPAEVLRLHLSSRHLVTSGNKSVMAQRLYHALHNADNSPSIVTTSPPPVRSSSTLTATSYPSATASSVPATIPPSPNSTRPIISTSAAMPTIPPSAVASEVSSQPELQSQLSSLMSHLIQLATAAISSQIAHTRPDPLPASTLDTPPISIQLRAAAVPSHLATTSDNLSPASTLDTPPPPLSIASTTQTIQPTSYTTQPLQNLPVTAHNQQLSFAQQIPAWPATYIPSSTLPLLPAASYPQSFSLPPVPVVNQTVSVPSAYIPPSHLQSSTSPPIPVQLRQQILQGEYVDFAMLLHRANFSDVSEVPVSSSRPPATKRIASFNTWMQAWNLYLAVILAHNPSRAVELFGYQRLICSANTLLPLDSWLQYDYKFRTLAAADPLLRWDQRHPDLWLECLASSYQSNKRWPCPYCRATNHFPDNCPHSPICTNKQQSSEHRTSNPRPSSRPICGMFNQGNCTCSDCSYRHICLTCEGNHPRVSCSAKKGSFSHK